MLVISWHFASKERAFVENLAKRKKCYVNLGPFAETSMNVSFITGNGLEKIIRAWV